MLNTLYLPELSKQHLVLTPFQQRSSERRDPPLGTSNLTSVIETSIRRLLCSSDRPSRFAFCNQIIMIHPNAFSASSYCYTFYANLTPQSGVTSCFMYF